MPPAAAPPPSFPAENSTPPAHGFTHSVHKASLAIKCVAFNETGLLYLLAFKSVSKRTD